MRFLRLFLPGLLCLASMSLLIGRSQEPEIETTVTPEKSSYLPGEPIFVDVTLTNRTDRPLAEQRFNLLLTNWACSDLIFESASPFVRNKHEGGCGWAGSCLSGAYGPDRTVEPGGSRTKTVLLNQWPQNIAGWQYRGINVLTLALDGFSSPYWLTFNQAKKLGGHVRRSQKSTPVLVWKVYSKDREDDETGEVETRRRVFARCWWVFNLEQTSGIPADKLPAAADGTSQFTPIEKAADLILGRTQPDEINAS